MTDPNIPTAAQAHTDAGAEAFVRYYFERLNLAWTTPKAGILAPLCQPTSKACAALESDAVRLVQLQHPHECDGHWVTVVAVSLFDKPKPEAD